MKIAALLLTILLYGSHWSMAQTQQGGFQLKIHREGKSTSERQYKDKAPVKTMNRRPERAVFYQLSGKIAEDTGDSAIFAYFMATDSAVAKEIYVGDIWRALDNARAHSPRIWSHCIISPSIGVRLIWDSENTESYLLSPDCTMIFKYQDGNTLNYSTHAPSIQDIILIYEATLRSSGKQRMSLPSPASVLPSHSPDGMWRPSWPSRKKKP